MSRSQQLPEIICKASVAQAQKYQESKMDSWDVKIQLDPPYNWARYRNHVFGPGDKVAGKVVSSPRSDESIDSIYIEFKGKCKTQHGHGKGEQKYEHQMFLLIETLFKGPYK